MEPMCYQDSYDLFCAGITPKNASLLEVGCGPGNITKYLLSVLPDLKIDATDLSEEMIRVAKTLVPQAHFQVMDALLINQLAKNYDAFVCGFCIPYLDISECRQLFEVSAAVVRSGGTGYFSWIEDAYTQSGFRPTSDGKSGCQMYFYTKEQLQEMLEKSGWIVTAWQQIAFPADNPRETHSILITQKNS